MTDFFASFFDEGFWLPDQVTWASFASTTQVRYVQRSDLYVCLLVVPIIFTLRSIFLAVIAPFIGRRLGLKDHRQTPEDYCNGAGDASSTVLRDAFKISRRPSSEMVTEIVKRTDLSEAYVLDWFRRRRRSMEPSRLDKFSDSCLYFTWYSGIFCYGLYALHDKCWFTDTRHFWKDYPKHPLSDAIYFYYMASISFYMSEVAATAFKTIKREDDLQMAIHHLVTLALLFFSWWINHCRIGSVVLVIHDCADVWLQLGKMAKYIQAQRLCDAAFVVFVVSWFVTRIVIFPLYPVFSVAFETEPYVDYFKSARINVWHACLGLLLALLVMNSLWFVRIMRAVIVKLKSGKVVDNRSDDED